MKRILFVTFVALLVMMSNLFNLVAQDSQCPAGAHENWQKAATDIFFLYDNMIKSGQPGGLPDVASLQDWRRQLDDLERPACDDQAYAALQKALNLTSDSVVGKLLGLSDAETWLSQAKGQEDNAAILLNIVQPTTEPPTPSPIIAAITDPKDGDTVPSKITIKGTYEPDSMGNNDIWVAIQAPDEKFYFQAYNGCTSNPESVHYRELLKTWDVEVNLGNASGNRGQDFAIVLFQVSPDVSQEFKDKYSDWCKNNTGLTDAEVQDRNLAILQVVPVTHE